MSVTTRTHTRCEENNMSDELVVLLLLLSSTLQQTNGTECKWILYSVHLSSCYFCNHGLLVRRSAMIGASSARGDWRNLLVMLVLTDAFGSRPTLGRWFGVHTPGPCKTHIHHTQVSNFIEVDTKVDKRMSTTYRDSDSNCQSYHHSFPCAVITI